MYICSSGSGSYRVGTSIAKFQMEFANNVAEPKQARKSADVIDPKAGAGKGN